MRKGNRRGSTHPGCSVAALHGAADAPHALGLGLAPPGRLHPEAGPPGIVAITPHGQPGASLLAVPGHSGHGPGRIESPAINQGPSQGRCRDRRCRSAPLAQKPRVHSCHGPGRCNQIPSGRHKQQTRTATPAHLCQGGCSVVVASSGPRSPGPPPPGPARSLLLLISPLARFPPLLLGRLLPASRQRWPQRRADTGAPRTAGLYGLLSPTRYPSNFFAFALWNCAQ